MEIFWAHPTWREVLDVHLNPEAFLWSFPTLSNHVLILHPGSCGSHVGVCVGGVCPAWVCTSLTSVA